MQKYTKMGKQKRAKSSLERLDGLLDGFLRERGLYQITQQQQVKELWPELVGEKIAAVTRCDDVEDGVLFVAVSSAAWRHELLYVKGSLLQQVQKKCSSIKNIVFK